MAFELPPSDTRVFLFHSPDASRDTSGVLDAVNSWLGKDRSGVRDITVTPDGQGGVYTTVICTLGKLSSAGVSVGSRDQVSELGE